MRFLALATDYDDTLAHDGAVQPQTYEALLRLKASGRKVLLVTGRDLDELLPLLTDPRVFDRIVADNGAVLYNPESQVVRLLTSPPPQTLLETLKMKGVFPLNAGRVIVATREPHEKTVIGAIRQLGLEYQVIFNKGAVMILPSGVNKASGLKAALKELSLRLENVVAVGDAENDHAFLTAAGFGFAVANALPSVKESADLVTAGQFGAGVSEAIEWLLQKEDQLRPKERVPPNQVSALAA